ncbi:MAG: type II toxin-antitoxin system PemK/MazF family toxin [Prevotella sp.]
MKRGEIYYIDIPFYTGSEMTKDRPGVIVSCDALNNTSPVVTVVYLTATAKRMTPGHVVIQSAHRLSTALCEQVYTVDKSRIGDYVGEVSEDEMANIDQAICRTLSLPWPGEPDEDEDVNFLSTEDVKLSVEVQAERDRLQAELGVYKNLYESLLDRLTNKV